MKLTMNQLESMEEIMSFIKKRCREIMAWKNQHCGGEYCDSGTISYVGFEQDQVDISVEEYWAYGGHETHYYSFLFTEILNDEWQDEYLSRYTALLEQQKTQKLEEDKERKARIIETEKKELERLKLKYQKDS